MSATKSLSLEFINGDLAVVEVFVEALEHFIMDLQALDPANDAKDSFVRHTASVDTMAMEIKLRVRDVRGKLDAFIEAAPAAHLWAEGVAP